MSSSVGMDTCSRLYLRVSALVDRTTVVLVVLTLLHLLFFLVGPYDRVPLAATHTFIDANAAHDLLSIPLRRHKHFQIHQPHARLLWDGRLNPELQPSHAFLSYDANMQAKFADISALFACTPSQVDNPAFTFNVNTYLRTAMAWEATVKGAINKTGIPAWPVVVRNLANAAYLVRNHPDGTMFEPLHGRLRAVTLAWRDANALPPDSSSASGWVGWPLYTALLLAVAAAVYGFVTQRHRFTFAEHLWPKAKLE